MRDICCNTCYIVTIRQRVCQSGVPINRESTYTNLEDLQNITLLNGYSLSISQGSVNTVNLIFTNPAFNLNFYFNINDCSCTGFDLPIQSGSFRIVVCVATRCCDTDIRGNVNGI